MPCRALQCGLFLFFRPNASTIYIYTSLIQTTTRWKRLSLTRMELRDDGAKLLGTLMSPGSGKAPGKRGQVQTVDMVGNFLALRAAKSSLLPLYLSFSLLHFHSIFLHHIVLILSPYLFFSFSFYFSLPLSIYRVFSLSLFISIVLLGKNSLQAPSVDWGNGDIMTPRRMDPEVISEKEWMEKGCVRSHDFHYIFNDFSSIFRASGTPGFACRAVPCRACRAVCLSFFIPFLMFLFVSFSIATSTLPPDLPTPHPCLPHPPRRSHDGRT